MKGENIMELGILLVAAIVLLQSTLRGAAVTV